MSLPGGMFTPRNAPLKEGRSLPGLPYAGPSRRALRPRQVALLVVFLICIPLIYYLYSGDSDPVPSFTDHADHATFGGIPQDASIHEGSDLIHTNPIANAPHQQGGPQAPASPDVNGGQSSDKIPFKAPPPENSLNQPKAPSVVEVDEDDIVPPREGAGSKPQQAFNGAKHALSDDSVTFAQRAKFEKSLRRVIDLMPGEMEGRDLLRHVEGTGKEKLREMGLRVREYKKYFEAWEDLHLSFDEDGGAYVRDDVIQYLRYNSHAADAQELAEGELAATVHSYEAYRYFLVKFGQLLFPWTAPYFPDHMTLHSHFRQGGRGIVLTAGDAQAPFLLTTIPTFRKLGCDLPIEVMYLGDSDLSEDYRQDLEALDGVITRDIAQMVNDEGWKLAGWAAKPFAILFSSFREVVFIDADSLFFKNPASLFEEPQYQKTGALFFRDRLIMPENKKRWLQQILPKPISRQVKQSRFWTGDSGHQQESGVIVVDKWRHFIALLLVTRMNGPDRDGNKEEGRVGVYDMVYGDKETFWLGWELVGDQDYAFHQGDAGIMGTAEARDSLDGKRRDKNEPPPPPPPPQKQKKKPKKKPAPPPPGEEGQNQTHDGEVSTDDKAEGEVDGDNEWEEIDEEPDETMEEPVAYTICAPQLLHLDLDGKPLWFNGWLMENKFADKKKKKFGTFEHYLIEPHDIRDPGAWQLEESNMCCLTAEPEYRRDFTNEEKALLAMMIQQAKDVGVPG
ncbi:hypothetical protein B0A52_09560 [Exophiala mesophila]|uniref:Alpha-1,3-mannosyltransferase n=1 Tax=Exophiala mesophila TaxID=212818 RepID=A0A438MVF0_EXOME|nr:hypothetical protein B0A52_09560 [Exophiala mesophila]